MALIFISGASSGIGLAMARCVPLPGSRVIDISRRGATGLEHFPADLAEPAEWQRVAALFAREIEGFAGERVVFVHSRRNARADRVCGRGRADWLCARGAAQRGCPQVLGDAFLRAAAATTAPCTLLFISSGAAHSVYEGWSAYGAGKAAVDQWVRTVGRRAEAPRRARARALGRAG